LAEAIAWAGHETISLSLVASLPPRMPTETSTNKTVLDAVATHDPDLLVVGNIHSADVDPGLLLLLAERFPTLCVLHDLWLLTGHCAYPLDCRKYLTGCDATCPRPDEYPRLEPVKIAGAWDNKRTLLQSNLPMLLANSEWAADYARRTLA